MKYFTSDPGNFMPSEMLTNPSDTVLESANDQASQQTGPTGTSWTRWNKPRWFRQKDSSKSLEAKFLALGTASVLATTMPLATNAKIILVENLPLDLLTTQMLDIDGDGVPDLSCEANNYITDNGWIIGNYVECVGINGDVLSENFASCEPPGPDEEDNDPSLPNLPKCLSGSTAQTEPKYLALTTSSDLNAWVSIEIDAGKPLAQVVAGAYEDCLGQPIANGQTSNGELAECPLPPPPSEVNAQIVSSGVTVTWKDNSNNETGFKVYRDGVLIGTTPANATSFTDTSLPWNLFDATYTVAATNTGGDSKPAEKQVPLVPKCPDYPNCAVLFIAVDHSTGSGKVTTWPNLISCEASDCHYDPTKDLYPQCNRQKCATSVNLGTTVTLTPVADSGSVFIPGHWGGHPDCVDGQMNMTENKLCVAYFRKVSPTESTPTVRDSPSRMPTPTLPTPTLPNQGVCVAIDMNGQVEETTAQISVEVSVNGTDSQPVVTAKPTDQIVIRANLRMEPQHQLAMVDILFFGSYPETAQDTWWMMDKDSNVLPWDKKPANLVSFRTGVPLTAVESTTLEIYRGTPPFNRGLVKVFLGYRLEDGKVVCGIKPVEIDVM